MNNADKNLNLVLGETVRTRRMVLEINTVEFSKALGKNAAYIRTLEQGLLEFTPAILKDCARALNTSVQELIEIALGEAALVAMGDIEDSFAEAV